MLHSSPIAVPKCELVRTSDSERGPGWCERVQALDWLARARASEAAPGWLAAGAWLVRASESERGPHLPVSQRLPKTTRLPKNINASAEARRRRAAHCPPVATYTHFQRPAKRTSPITTQRTCFSSRKHQPYRQIHAVFPGIGKNYSVPLATIGSACRALRRSGHLGPKRKRLKNS